MIFCVSLYNPHKGWHKMFLTNYSDVIMGTMASLNHQRHGCLLNRPSRRRSKKTSKLCVTGLCAGNSWETGEFPTQKASNAGNVSIWWRHHMILNLCETINSCILIISTKIFIQPPLSNHCFSIFILVWLSCKYVGQDLSDYCVWRCNHQRAQSLMQRYDSL